jgi:ketosteroid isomerase-like protein
MTIQDLIVQHENQRAQAIVARDAKALDGFLADDLVFVHSNGHIDTKASFIALAVSGQYVGWTQAELDVKVYDTVAVVAGHRSVDVQRRSQARRSVNTRFVDIWVLEGDAWRNTRSQSSALPA